MHTNHVIIEKKKDPIRIIAQLPCMDAQHKNIDGVMRKKTFAEPRLRNWRLPPGWEPVKK